jgi:FKBP-type peptidyl-prolyl cis-trans isomerase FklB
MPRHAILETIVFNRKDNQIMGAREDGIKFLQDNLKRENVESTASGLQYEVIREGSGKQPGASNTVEVHYKGTFLDGTTFDSSYDRGQTIEFPLNRVIAGWTEGLQLMKEGAHYRLFIPYNLAYGEGGAGPIPGYSTLIFDVELINVK